jgi:ATP-dependent Clp protease, protease subunit
MKKHKERIWVKEFDDVSLEEFFSLFIEMEGDPFVDIIPIVVSSYGGSLDNLLAMRDLIKGSKKAVSVTAIGKAMSAGSALLAAGTKGLRFVAPNTNIMIHEASGWARGKVEDVKADVERLQFQNEKFIQFLSEDMGKSIAWLKKELHKRKNADWFLTAEEAVKLGMADHVGVPRIFVSPPQQAMQLDIAGEEEKKVKKTKKRS